MCKVIDFCNKKKLAELKMLANFIVHLSSMMTSFIEITFRDKQAKNVFKDKFNLGNFDDPRTFIDDENILILRKEELTPEEIEIINLMVSFLPPEKCLP